jgi:cysteine synthase A
MTLPDSRLRVAEDVTELVGGTPILHLRRIPSPGTADVYAKLEFLNPGGSIKDRSALSMLVDAVRSGELVPGESVVVESSSGNLAVGLA